MRWIILALAVLSLTVAGLCAEPKVPPTFIPSPDAFRTLVNPNCSHCRDEAKRRAGELRSDDRVLCWTRDTKGKYQGGAIPIRFFLASHRVISDTYGVFVYDPEAGFARGFAPSLDFTFHGWRNGVMVMKHKDGTLYSCLTGLAFAGPKKGARLRAVPTLVSDWGFWLKHYPDSVAYRMDKKFAPVELPHGVQKDSLKSRRSLDPRLGADTLVLGVNNGKSSRAYPLKALSERGLIRDTLDGRELLVLWYGPTKTAAAYLPRAITAGNGAARTVTLKLDLKHAAAPFVDAETGSRWDIVGRAVEGALKGSTLEWLDSTQVKWFAWAAEYPKTSVYRER